MLHLYSYLYKVDTVVKSVNSSELDVFLLQMNIVSNLQGVYQVVIDLISADI